MARSYGFTFVFIMARAPHIFSWHWKTEIDFVTYRWFLVFGALIVPDLILQADELFRRLEELPSGTEITLSRIYDATRGRDFVQIMMREKADI